MSINWTTIRQTIVDWLVIETGWTVVWSKQNAPRPAKPYVLLDITSINKIGQDERLPIIDPEEPSCIRGDREFTLSISTLANDQPTAESKASEVLDSLSKADTLDRFDAVNISAIEDFGITDISALLETLWEPRALLDIRFLATSLIVDDTGTIEEVDILGAYAREDSTELKLWTPMTDDFDSLSWNL